MRVQHGPYPKRGLGSHPLRKGGRTLRKDGYWYVWIGPRTRNLEHRVVMEAKLGRPLLRREIVHHIDGNRQNNELDNLMLFANQAEHMRHHNIQVR